MFNFVTREEVYKMQKQIDDLDRALKYEKAERANDANRIKEMATYEGHLKRHEHIEACYKAEALAEAAENRATNATAYADKTVAMAAKCAADFAAATAKMTEQFLAVIKELKPVCQEAKLTVLPTTVNNDCRKEGASIKMS